jgi:CubicO group peptidase (beta-lactamase class C family)
MAAMLEKVSSGLRRSPATSKGLSPVALQACVSTLQHEFELHSFMLAVDSDVVAEAWWEPYKPSRQHMQHSATKSFMQVGVGLAAADGLVSVNDPVAKFFPEFAAEFSYGDTLTVEHLLTMSVGHERAISGSVWRPIQTSWVREFFREPSVLRPGNLFLYTSAASYMLSGIVQKVTGQTLEQYMRPRFFEPLGIENFHWDQCPHGISTGGNGLSCETEALLKLGLLHFQKGSWDGGEILPAWWVKRATTTQISPAPLFGVDSGDGYGYQWWTRPDGSYYAWGIFGQYCIVMPRFKAVLAVTGGMPQAKNSFISAVERHLHPLLTRAGKGVSKDGQAELATFLQNVTLLRPSSRTSSDVAVTVCGRDLSVESNDLRIQTIRLDFNGSACAYTQVDSRGVHTITGGFSGWHEGKTSMTGNHLHHEYQLEDMAIVACAEWTDARTLVMTWQFVESAFRDVVTLRFDENGTFTLDREVNANTGPLKQPTLFGRWI